MNDSRTARDPVRIKKCTPRLEDIFAQGFDRELLETTRFGVEPNQIRPVESEPTKPRSVYSTGEIRPLESERNETCSGSVPESSRVQSESESEAPREATKAPPRRAPASLLHCTDRFRLLRPRAPSRGVHTPRPRASSSRGARGLGRGWRTRGRTPTARSARPRGFRSARRRGARGEAPGGPSDDARPPPSYASSSHASSSSSRARARGPAASAPPSVPSSLPASDDALALAVEAACDGMDARAALRWVRLERDAYAALAAYHERRAAERDTHTRQRLRALGMWRLMGKLGLDVETSERSRVMVLAWLRACRDRLRASSSLDGRAPRARERGRRRAPPDRARTTASPARGATRDRRPSRAARPRPEPYPKSTRRGDPTRGRRGRRRRQLVVVGIDPDPDPARSRRRRGRSTTPPTPPTTTTTTTTREKRRRTARSRPRARRGSSRATTRIRGTGSAAGARAAVVFHGARGGPGAQGGGPREARSRPPRRRGRALLARRRRRRHRRRDVSGCDFAGARRAAAAAEESPRWAKQKVDLRRSKRLEDDLERSDEAGASARSAFGWRSRRREAPARRSASGASLAAGGARAAAESRAKTHREGRGLGARADETSDAPRATELRRDVSSFGRKRNGTRRRSRRAFRRAGASRGAEAELREQASRARRPRGEGPLVRRGGIERPEALIQNATNTERACAKR